MGSLGGVGRSRPIGFILFGGLGCADCSNVISYILFGGLGGVGREIPFFL